MQLRAGRPNLRRDLRRDLRELGVHPPLSVEDLTTRLGELRGRRIEIYGRELPADVFGVWIPGATTDYIVYQTLSTPVHQRHFQLHEFGHIYCGHQPDHRLDLVTTMLRGDGINPRVATDIQGGLARRPVAPPTQDRTGYTDTQEHEAETVATTIMEWASVADHVTPPRAGHGSVQQLQLALGERWGWL